ncbi:hypothetical protein D9M68_743230 [compost metagenome]
MVNLPSISAARPANPDLMICLCRSRHGGLGRGIFLSAASIRAVHLAVIPGCEGSIFSPCIRARHSCKDFRPAFFRGISLPAEVSQGLKTPGAPHRSKFGYRLLSSSPCRRSWDHSL